MVVGGMAARADLSVDEIDDVYMALEEVFWAAREKGSAQRCSMRISAVEGSLTMELGPFGSPSVARHLGEPACTLLARVVAFEVREGPGDQLSVVLTKRREVIGR
jgi:hypothetical protein